MFGANGLDVAAALLRLMLGTVMLVHGLGHAFAGLGIAAATALLALAWRPRRVS